VREASLRQLDLEPILALRPRVAKDERRGLPDRSLVDGRPRQRLQVAVAQGSPDNGRCAASPTWQPTVWLSITVRPP